MLVTIETSFLILKASSTCVNEFLCQNIPVAKQETRRHSDTLIAEVLLSRRHSDALIAEVLLSRCHSDALIAEVLLSHRTAASQACWGTTCFLPKRVHRVVSTSRGRRRAPTISCRRSCCPASRRQTSYKERYSWSCYSWTHTSGKIHSLTHPLPSTVK